MKLKQIREITSSKSVYEVQHGMVIHMSGAIAVLSKFKSGKQHRFHWTVYPTTGSSTGSTEDSLPAAVKASRRARSQYVRSQNDKGHLKRVLRAAIDAL